MFRFTFILSAMLLSFGCASNANAATYWDLPPSMRGDAVFKSDDGTQTNATVDSNGVTADQVRADVITNKAGTGAPPGFVPIGGMVPVMPAVHANAWQPPATGVVKDGFMRADGAAVPGSCTDCVIPAGTNTPNMVNRYARGNTNSGATGGANTQASNVSIAQQPAFTVPGHYHGMGAGSDLNITSSGSASVSGTTNIGHTHAASSVTGTTNIAHTHAASAVTGTTNIAHSHGTVAVTGSVDIDHDHPSVTVTGTVGGSDGTHAHTGNSTVASTTHHHSLSGVYTNIDNAGGNVYARFRSGSFTSNYRWATGATVADSSSLINSVQVSGDLGNPDSNTTVVVGSASSGHGHAHSLSANVPNYDVANVALSSGVTGTISLGATNVALASGSAAGQTLGTTNVSIASGSAAGQTLATTNVALASGAAAAHTHAAGNFAGSIGLVTGGSNGNGAFSATRTADVTLSNPAVNNEPAYMEVVWVMRVK